MRQPRHIGFEELVPVACTGHLFAIIDSCVHPGAIAKADVCGQSVAQSLFHATTLDQYYGVAPYLFRVDSSLLSWIASSLTEQPWGIFVATKSTFENLVLHLQRFFMALLPNGTRWFFRYYDPRVLAPYLSSCQESELREFFGPIRGFVIPSADKPDLALFPNPFMGSDVNPDTTAKGESLWVIRADQYRSLELSNEEEFEKRVARFLVQHLPIGLLPPTESLKLQVRNGIQRARSYGMTWESTIISFVAASIELGPRFDLSPAFQRILRDGDTPPNAIMQTLIATATPADWTGIRANSSSGASNTPGDLRA